VHCNVLRYGQFCRLSIRIHAFVFLRFRHFFDTARSIECGYSEFLSLLAVFFINYIAWSLS